jgi:predicted adenylyl cyclase CyaB
MQKKKIELEHVLGTLAVVDKKRELWVAGHTRIHLDSVKKLGKFLELETVVSNISDELAYKEHKQVIKNLELNKYKKYSQSYGDMILGV